MFSDDAGHRPLVKAAGAEFARPELGTLGTALQQIAQRIITKYLMPLTADTINALQQYFDKGASWSVLVGGPARKVKQPAIFL